MKYIKNNICYVDMEDILRFPIPQFVCNQLPSDLELYEFVSFQDSKIIQYFQNRLDIVDYNSICGLSEEELSERIHDCERKYIQYSDLKCNGKYKIIVQNLKIVYQSLCNYQANRSKIDKIMKHIELRQNRKDIPWSTLTSDGKVKLSNFEPKKFAENHAPNGFIETYCLSDEQKEAVAQYRKTK